MSRDYTRFTHNPQKHYSGVLMQQGRVQLDADWNEAQEIGDRRWRAETLDLMGQAAVPETTPDAFRLQPDGAGSLTIGLGRMYVDGLLAENHGLAPQAYNAQLGELYGTTPTPYNQQPYCSNPPTLSTTPGLTDLLYLDVWQREVSILEDPNIQEIALGGPDTATRLQTVWQVKALTNVGSTTCGAAIAPWDNLIEPSAGRLTTAAVAPPTNTDPCIISPKAGYRGIENRLYRIEIHTGGTIGTAKFKWSRDNGSVVSAVERIETGRDRITVRRIGHDSVLRFKEGDWVEVLDDAVEFSDNPVGHLAKITKIEETNRVLEISPPIPASFNFPTNATTQATDPVRHTRVRRWDQKHDPDGLLTVNPGPIDLEDGIQVSFSVDSAIGTDFKVGDAWVLAARSADASVELLDKAPPRSILHHYARLALVTQTGTVPSITDCRTLFPAARCCIVVRPGEDIQAAINKLCQTGGCICLAPGVHLLHKPLLIDGCKNLTIQGIGNATRLIYSPTNAEADAAMIYVVGGSQAIWLENFLCFADRSTALVAVDEDSRIITLKHLTLINALTDQNDQQPQATCILLGNCCRVSVTESTLLGNAGLLQTDVKRLQNLREQIGLTRSPLPTPAATAPLPPTVATLTGLKFNHNALYVLNIGVSLEDALDGSIGHNRIQGLPSQLEFHRSDEPRLKAETQIDRWEKIDQLLSLLACPPANSTPVLVRSVGLFACLLDQFEIADNQIQAVWGIFLSFARGVNIVGNRIEFGRVAGEFRDKLSDAAFVLKIQNIAAIAIAFGFDVQVQHNVIHGLTGQLEKRERISLTQDYLSDRANTGNLGIALGSVRGITVCENHIHAMSGIGTGRWLIENTQVRGAAAYPDSLLRVLGIRRAWRVFAELAWVIWQFIQIAQQSTTTTGGVSPADTTTTRLQFRTMLVEGLVKLLTAPDLIPNFVGKAEITQNQMQVSRFGICFPSIFTVGGLQILGNRISGFTETGILVHPWLSVSFPDLTAQLLYCGLEWILGVLTLLRDALDAMLKGQPPATPAGAGNWTAAEIGVALVSWTVSFCAKYCGGDPPIGGTPGDGTPPRSPSDDLKDAIDDLLNHLDLAWLDDLVNQSYVIDGNTLRGSGDGIWVGIDGSQISHNHVTIHPTNTATFETMVLGILMRQSQVSGNLLVLLPYFLVEMDRDLILFAALLFDQTASVTLSPSINPLRSAINTFLTIVLPTSPLQPSTLALRDVLQSANPDTEAIKAALVALLSAIAHNTKGYGIALMGADMTCIHNRVEGTTSCGVEALTNRSRIALPNIDNRRLPTVVRHPAIAGIWQFSNILNLSFEIFAVAGRTSTPNAVQPKGSIGRSLNLISLVIAYFLLLSRKERGLHLQSNGVETALAYGIRTLDVTGLEEVSILDNAVKNAVRYAIAHQSLIGQDQKCYVKVHRNTVTRTQEVFDLFRTIPPNLNQ
ncbi:MAG: DUF6519 domain-containing protein [Thermosynechococcaceae cyanobacterium]